MTDQELTGIARQALNIAHTAIENERYTGIVLATWYKGEGLRRMKKVERLLAERLGEGWLNDDQAKSAGFGMLRMALDHSPQPPDAFIMVTATNLYKSTAKYMALDRVKQDELLLERNYPRLLAEGLMTVMDSYTATVQTPERVCVANQQVDHGRFVGQPETRCGPQSQFGGRTKFYGEDTVLPRKAAQ